MTALDAVLQRLAQDFEAVGLHWALIGGLAVSARAEPRTTRDVDVAVAVADDSEAEQAVLALRQRGYPFAGQMIERQVTGRLAPMRILFTLRGCAGDRRLDVCVNRDRAGVRGGGHANRSAARHDDSGGVARASTRDEGAGSDAGLADFSSLFRHASADDLVEARAALALIRERRSNRQMDLFTDFERLCAAAQREAQET